ITRPFEVQRKLLLGVSLLLYVPLGTRRALLPEMALWPLATEEMGEPILDAGIPKSRAEYLIAGAAYPALGEEGRECEIRASVHGRTKTLKVSGDRYWNGDRISEPLPFRKLPLEWRYAFGGSGDVHNPAGRGVASENIASEEV